MPSVSLINGKDINENKMVLSKQYVVSTTQVSSKLSIPKEVLTQ